MGKRRRKQRMSRPIKLTDQYLEELRADFEQALKLTKLSDGKLSFTKTFTNGDRKATVFFEPTAWAKMAMLIKEFDKEVAWHGVAKRGEDEEKDEYIIEDIVVYPQEVSGATVEMDTEKYATWLMENDEDERFHNIHMQGHSHVNMPTSPSSVDLNHQEEILNMLGDDDFYIFMIWNKSFISTNKIYDLKKNTLFENSDITVKMVGQNEGLDEFLNSAKSMVKTKAYVYTTPTYQSTYTTPTRNQSAPVGAPYNPMVSSPAKQANPVPTKTEGEKPRTRIGAGWGGSSAYQQRFDGYDDDDMYGYDTYGKFGGGYRGN